MTDFDAGIYSDGLRRLTVAIEGTGADMGARGFLGGEHGYGAHYDNGTFTMRPFFWGGCDCGFENRELEWDAAHPHAEDCYRSELERRHSSAQGSARWLDVAARLADELGMPETGCATHCTCGKTENYIAWREANGHTEGCTPFLPNFRYKETGLEISFYKYIGRGMWANQELDSARWESIVNECVDSLKVSTKS